MCGLDRAALLERHLIAAAALVALVLGGCGEDERSGHTPLDAGDAASDASGEGDANDSGAGDSGGLDASDADDASRPGDAGDTAPGDSGAGDGGGQDASDASDPIDTSDASDATDTTDTADTSDPEDTGDDAGDASDASDAADAEEDADAAPPRDPDGGTEECPVENDGGFCQPTITWAKNPDTGTCCEYNNSCEVPDGWQTYSSKEECRNS